MNEAKTINVKGLEHIDRERLIFGGIGSLGPNDKARLVVEFNPLPLMYMLNAEGGFEVSYEKEGPDEWVLMVTKLGNKEDRKEQFKELLAQMHKDETSAEAKERARELLQEVDAKTLGLMEQELIREGISHDEIRKGLCDIHLEVLKDSLVSKRIEVAAPHPVNTFMEEHKVILRDLKELESILEGLKGKTDLEGKAKDKTRLAEIAHHLMEAESHHRREEEVLFPYLEKHGITEPPAVMKMDHAELRKRKEELHSLVREPQGYAVDEFKTGVVQAGGYLVRELPSHIFKEDNILYQIALQIVSPGEWDEIKAMCDQIGYCCFTPSAQGVRTTAGHEAAMWGEDILES